MLAMSSVGFHCTDLCERENHTSYELEKMATNC